MTITQTPGLYRKIDELLNRKPSKWGNVATKTFEQDIELLQKVVKQQRDEIHKLNGRIKMKDSIIEDYW